MRGSNLPRNTSDHCTSHPKVPRRLRDVLACLRRRLSLGVPRTSCSQIVHWRSNLFKVPSGSIGKWFVAKIVHLFEAFATESALEAVALKAAMTLPALLLQKPHAKSKIQEPICMHHQSS